MIHDVDVWQAVARRQAEKLLVAECNQQRLLRDLEQTRQSLAKSLHRVEELALGADLIGLGVLTEVRAALGDPAGTLEWPDLIARARDAWAAHSACPADSLPAAQEPAAEPFPPPDTCSYPLCSCPADHPGIEGWCAQRHPTRLPLAELKQRPEWARKFPPA